MADLSDVENALKALIVSRIYPGGTTAPSAMTMPDATPIPARVVRGWPNKLQLKSDLAAGIVTISISPMPGSDRDTTRYSMAWEEDKARAPQDRTPMGVALAASVSGAPDKVTWSGVATCAQSASVTVDGRAYRVAVPVGATASDVAAAFVAAINPDRPVTQSGGSITLVGAYGLKAAMGVIVERGLVREIGRFQRSLQIALWCKSPEQRDAANRFIFGVMSGAGTARGTLDFIDIPEIVQTTPTAIVSSSKAQITYGSRNQSDDPEMAGLFRANFLYTVEFGQFEWSDGAAIVSIEAELTPYSTARSFDPNTTPEPEALIDDPMIVHI